MRKSDVKMEDSEKLPNDPGNNTLEVKSKALDAKVESEAERSPCAAVASADVNKRENGREDLDKCAIEVKDKSEVKTEEKDQINPKTEANKPVEGSVSEKINTKSENEQLINMETEAAEQSSSMNAVEKNIDAKYEGLEQKDTDSEVEETKSAENSLEGGNVVRRSSEDVAGKKLKEAGEEDMNYAEHFVGGDLKIENADAGNNPRENRQLPTELSANEDLLRQDTQLNDVLQAKDEQMEDSGGMGIVLASPGIGGNGKIIDIVEKHDAEESSFANQQDKPEFVFRGSKAADDSGEIGNTVFTQATLPLTGEGDDGTPEDQAAFMKEIENFYRGRAMDFKPPKFYGQPLNCLKLWRAVIRLGGYDKVTGSKLWRQVGESFNPPKTCTTVSWTFRIFYEKSLLEYERHKTQSGELQLPIAMLPEVSAVDGEGNGYQGSGSGSGRARRDAAARAIQGWHANRLSDCSEDKNLNNAVKHEKNLKTIGSLKQKRPNDVEHSSKAARTELSKQLATSVVDIGPPADWVKINVHQTKDCFEVYALVPGLLREEVRVQSDPAGRVVITGQPEKVDNPWGITPFKKVVSLPARIDPLQTSAVVSLHGRLLVRVPYEQPNS